MSLKDINLKIEYRTLVDNMTQEFYIPLLKEAVIYKRAVGFFSSSILIEIGKGINGLVKNGGSIKLIASPNLSEKDIEAIRYGYKKRDEVIKNAISRELREPVNKYQAKQLNYLANLIADEILDIRIAITESDLKTGMYHEKVGIIEDREGNKIAFSGSMNESANALLANYETIDVFKSWKDTEGRVERKEAAFDNIWNNCEPNVRVIDIDGLSEEIIRRYKKEEIDYDSYITNSEEIDSFDDSQSYFRIPESITLYEYQKEAVAKWIEKGACGIFDMATGTGKTYTGLAAVSTLSKSLNHELAVVIVAPYRHLVEQWVEDIRKFGVTPIVAYSYPGQCWRKELQDALIAYNCKAISGFCVITTNATFSGNDFQQLLSKFRRNFCFMVDEAHNFGAKKLSTLLPKKARYRLALSATIERHRDPNGTEALRKYFGPVPCISFSLKKAIKNKFLTPYFYYPEVVFLNEDELDRYNELTEKIVKIAGFNAVLTEENSYLDMLLIQRARIIAGCQEKIPSLINKLKEYKDESNILVYCGATKYDRKDISDEEDVRQIDEVNKRINRDLHMSVRKFTSSEGIEERTEIKEMFINKEIQVITAIKCLDEGVNIPAIQKAFILASSTNPKEYIQRRGRVLRKAEGKKYAEIFDFITLPRPLSDVKYLSIEEKKNDLTLVRREFARMIDFAYTAKNPSRIEELKRKIEDAYTIVDLAIDGEEIIDE